ncbi:UDP-N-acetylmuramoyl-L-alanyl-D-glutamate--L-lysine ligase [Streptococcus sp. E17BB]|uniref:UDP-N-acetylmuramoyl-L-alanyl-D-glutamate--L- lysine ligase n=1 Tax=Streptococcus sp. E17BB TaxID=3278714 RepID=UPI00359E7288
MINLLEIFEILKADDNLVTLAPSWADTSFTKLSYDSRQVDADTLFFVKGAGFAPVYLEQAVQAGLTYYVAEKTYDVACSAIVVKDVKRAMSLIAMRFYDNPQDKLKLLGFTGTKGKTTAAYFAYHILRQSHKPALLSTMSTTLDGETFFKSQLTTPESLDLFAMMAEAVQNGRSHLIMEVSSQAYLTKRVYGLTFDVGVFLNITPDHISPIEHPNFEDYFAHKRLLLDNSRAVIVNAGMDHATVVLEQVAGKDLDTYGKGSDNRVVTSSAFDFTATGKLAGQYSIQLLGDFNQDNAIAAGLACLRLGASLTDIRLGIAQTTVPGRMEILTQTNGAKVFVDYAHNGDSLDKLIKVVTTAQTGQVFLIIGSTGNKAESRRADFGRVINHYPELQIILTADDPNREDPFAICQEIAGHINRPVTIEVDREAAIRLALSQTKTSQDAVIIAGKGRDAYQIINDQKVPYQGDWEIANQNL